MFKKQIKTLGITIAAVSTLGAATPALAVDDLLQDAGSWLQIVGEGSLGVIDPRLQKGRVWLEGQSRFDDNWDHWYQGMVRVAAGYSLSDRATIWAGYTWLPTQNVGKAYVAQQDVWPAFRYVLPTDIGTFMFRTMVESNFLPGNNSEVRVRPRQMVRFMHPLEFEPRLSLIAWDEFFVRVNSTPTGGQAGFDQNRAFAGLGWTFNKSFRAEAGYLNQYLDDATHTNNTMHHLIMGSLFINF
ncbi:hypothetical protein MGMO_85c00160 [Methyloglobulus morosus KoM1]|uniref:DUF2490 domain-containing protein n=1 Tax=Methyloglobulus morosus KoM1 TaxID=1116472 RepID=V5DX39_9GAMM|nr:DUF2490 domain-containing protein [Methyloglobulus morosus]ESS71891.1 hypothetical protein MGMO_85c00160 [Methyloglobulus morosus KoM1]